MIDFKDFVRPGKYIGEIDTGPLKGTFQVRPLLYVTIGIPGSGKSTFCREFKEVEPNLVHLSRDDLREEYCPGGYTSKKEAHLRGIIAHTISLHLLEGRSVIYDATNTKRAERQWMRELADDAGAKLPIICVMFPCGLEDAIARRRGIVPEDAVRRIHTQLLEAPPHTAEGIELYTVRDGQICA
jgi:predicted kinase